MKRPAAWLVGAVAIALLGGALARVTFLERKIFFQDEAYAALRITGHTEAAYLRTFDGAVHPLSDVLAFQRLDAASSPATTLASIAREEPQRGPLYYALAALWVRFAGTSIAGFRSLSALIGLLEIAAAFVFGRVFFRSARGGWILAALVAVSPFHIRYAQQAREYGAFGLAVFASTACLVLALRGRRLGWAAYALTCAAGLGASPLFALVLASHASYVAYTARSRGDVRRVLAAYAGATACGIVPLIPWFVFASQSAGTVGDQTQWAASPYPAAFALTKWVFNVGATFFDYEFADIRYAAVLVGLLPLVAFAVWRTLAREPAARAMALALALPTLGAFLVKDRLSHAHFATIPRYLTPVWIALEIAVAAGLVGGFEAPSRLARRSSHVAFGFILACGVWCAAADSGPSMWWDNNDNEPTSAVADVVNMAPRAVVATSNVAITLSLVHYLRSARMLLYPRDALPRRLDLRASPRPGYFAFLPSSAERAALANRGMTLTNVSPQGGTIVRSFHAALERDRPGPRNRSLVELSGPNALWQLATGDDPERAARRRARPRT